MKYISTRDDKIRKSAAEAIVAGLAPNGGLFVPESFPICTYSDVKGLSYKQTAHKILSKFLPEYSDDFLKSTVNKVYSDENFSAKAGFVKHVKNNEYSLELYHGPTCAFKDYALQLMPHLFTHAKKITGDTSTTKILVATSGDTGKAALEGFANLPGIKIAVFYPTGGTSEIQRLQMVTQQGDNVSVYAVNGNFDDAQTGVKKVFSSSEVAQKLKTENACLSSANSINWGRLLPQIVYYFYSYAHLVQTGAVKEGEKVNYCVPTGNFGDILAGFYAKKMGLPVGKLICASNKNNVLADFFSTGEYNANREFFKTTSPSMDILISSNLERLLYHAINDASEINRLMAQLNETGKFKLGDEVMGKIKNEFEFEAGFANDEEAFETIKQYKENANYLMDTHTAVAFCVAQKLNLSEKTPLVVLSTASPFKFADDVLIALDEKPNANCFENLEILSKVSNENIPNSLKQLNEKQERFNETVSKNEIEQIALKM